MSCKSKKPRKVRKKRRKKMGVAVVLLANVRFLGVVNVRILGVVNVRLANNLTPSYKRISLGTDTCVWPILMWAKPNLNSLTHKRAWIKREQQSNLWLHRNISLLTEIYKLSKSKTPRARGNLVTNFAGNPGSTCGRKSSFNLWGNPVWGIAAAYQGTG